MLVGEIVVELSCLGMMVVGWMYWGDKEYFVNVVIFKIVVEFIRVGLN